jgi:hypothetical protein
MNTSVNGRVVQIRNETNEQKKREEQRKEKKPTSKNFSKLSPSSTVASTLLFGSWSRLTKYWSERDIRRCMTYAC